MWKTPIRRISLDRSGDQNARSGLRRFRSCWLVLVVLALASATFAADWPGYRGQAGRGVRPETGWARAWGESGPREVWRRSIGDAFAGMAVVDGRIFTQEIADGEQKVVALDAATGKTLWATEVWHLDPATFLEVAVDSQVVDFSQATEPMTQRAFYGDFRQVAGVMLPHELSLEFGARLEEIRLESARVNPELSEDRFRMPAVEGEKESEKAAESP